MTLADLINRLPRVLAARFSKDLFWVQAANDVLLDIELKAELPRTKAEYPIALVEKLVTYPLPDEVRKVLGVYAPCTDTPLIDYTNKIDYQIRGRLLEIREPKVKFNETPILTATTTLAGPSTVQFANPSPEQNVENMMVLRGADASGIDAQIVARQDDTFAPGTTQVWTKRPWATQPAAAEFVHFFQYFVVVEYVRGFARVTDPVAAIVDYDEELLRVMRAGMRYYGELQADEQGELTQAAAQEYQRILQAYVAHENRGKFKPGPNFKVGVGTMRTIPTRVYGNNSGIFGDRSQQG